MPYGGTGGLGPCGVVMLLAAEILAGFGAEPASAAAAEAAEAAATSDAAAVSTCLPSFVAPPLPTISADDLRDASSCCFMTSPIGTNWPSVLTVTCMSAFVIWSEYAIVPRSSAMSCKCRFHADG